VADQAPVLDVSLVLVLVLVLALVVFLAALAYGRTVGPPA